MPDITHPDIYEIMNTGELSRYRRARETIGFCADCGNEIKEGYGKYYDVEGDVYCRSCAKEYESEYMSGYARIA